MGVVEYKETDIAINDKTIVKIVNYLIKCSIIILSANKKTKVILIL